VKTLREKTCGEDDLKKRPGKGFEWSETVAGEKGQKNDVTRQKYSFSIKLFQNLDQEKKKEGLKEGRHLGEGKGEFREIMRREAVRKYTGRYPKGGLEGDLGGGRHR